MKVRVHAVDEGGCGWYRMRFPAAAAKANGLDVELDDGVDTLRYQDGEGREHVYALTHDADPGDVVVLQRPLRREVVELIGVLQAAGVAVVVDMDDDFHALPPGHPSKRATSAAVNPEENRLWLRRACERADLVTVSTPALADRYGSHGRCVVLRNCVPEAYLGVHADRLDERPVVGWTGSVRTHVGDLDVTGGGVARAVTEAGARFHVVGTGIGVADALQLADEPTTTGWVHFDDYALEYARLDVAVVPLADNPFNAAKSWLKGMEAAALGVPFVASEVAEYDALAQEGAGLSACSPWDWQDEVAGLVASEGLRERLAGEGREVAARWTYEKRWGDWATAWAEAAANARQRRKVAA